MGGNADRRFGKLLREAAKARVRTARYADSARWFDELKSGENGEPKDIIANVTTILRADPKFAGVLRWCEMRSAALTRGLPWDPTTDWREWTDLDDARLAEWCQLRDVPVKSTTCAAAVQIVAAEHPHHAVREYLEGLVWDGTSRLDTWLSTYLGVADSLYTRAIGRKWIVSAVARVMQPGCKADHALILEGRQGAGKSTTAKVLAVCQEWFADEIADLGSKDSAQDLRGKWIIEISELSAMRRAEIERVKAFMSRAVDHYRPSYGRRSQDFPRQCVFIGSTNAEAYLADESGNRRFWPVKVGKIRLAKLRADLAQLWAEARAAYLAGETWWLDAEAETLARAEQAERMQGDPWEEKVLEHAEKMARIGEPVIIGNVLRDVLFVQTERQDVAAEKRVAQILRAAGWTRGPRRRIGGVLKRPYVPPPPPGAAAPPPAPTPNCSPSEDRGEATGNSTGNRANPGADQGFSPAVPRVPHVHHGFLGNRGDHHTPSDGASGGGGPCTDLQEPWGTRGTGNTPPGWTTPSTEARPW
jgi:predicted P-loop ATPase